MHRIPALYGLILPATFMKGECIPCHLSFYRRTQYWPATDMREYQMQRLTRLLRYVQRSSPYYRRRFAEVGCDAGSPLDRNDFSRIPFLTKQDLVAHGDDITTRRRVYSSSKTTGGSTGRAVTLCKNPGALARERAATARAYEWAGVHLGDPQARFWGVPISDLRRVSARIVDIVANRKRVSAFGFDDYQLRDALRMLHEFRPVYLYGYASLIVELALFADREKLKLPSSVTVAITTSEVLTSDMRETIETCLGVRVYNEYGCGEVGSVAHECELGTMHIMAENLIVEVLDENGQPADSGELVVTDLHNYATPLIRYRLADYASRSDTLCGCGRTLPALSGIHGRAYDVIVSPSGRRYHPEAVMYVFELLRDRGVGIDQFQLIQDRIDHFLIRIVRSESSSTDSIEKAVREQIAHALTAEFALDFEYVDRIEREPSGKLRLIRSAL